MNSNRTVAIQEIVYNFEELRSSVENSALEMPFITKVVKEAVRIQAEWNEA